MLGRALGALRTARGLKQVEVAKAAGIAPETLNRIEAGRTPSYKTLQRVCEAIGVSITDVEEAAAAFSDRSPPRQDQGATPAPDAPATRADIARLEAELRALREAVEGLTERLPRVDDGSGPRRRGD